MLKFNTHTATTMTKFMKMTVPIAKIRRKWLLLKDVSARKSASSSRHLQIVDQTRAAWQMVRVKKGVHFEGLDLTHG